MSHVEHWDPAVASLIAQARREGAVETLRIVRLVEQDMAACAFDAWRSADARRGLSDHDALLQHADALTRWSERLRMAFDGQDYRQRMNPYLPPRPRPATSVCHRGCTCPKRRAERGTA